MGEYDFRDNLVTLSRFPTPTEAELARLRLADEGIKSTVAESATATTLSYLGFGMVGAKLTVRQGDLHRARDILADVFDQDGDDEDEEDVADYDADDWSGEDWADDDDDEYNEAPAFTPPLNRAFRASIFGLFLVIPFSFYALWILLRHRTWEPAEGHDRVNWRFYATLVLIGLGTMIHFLLWRTG